MTISRWRYQHDSIQKANTKLCEPNAKPCESNAKPCGPNAKPCGPNAKHGGPNMSQWNILHVGSLGIGACVGHVDFMLFLSISFALEGQQKRNFWWNMGLFPQVNHIYLCFEMNFHFHFRNSILVGIQLLCYTTHALSYQVVWSVTISITATQVLGKHLKYRLVFYMYKTRL